MTNEEREYKLNLISARACESVLNMLDEQTGLEEHIVKHGGDSREDVQKRLDRYRADIAEYEKGEQ